MAKKSPEHKLLGITASAVTLAAASMATLVTNNASDLAAIASSIVQGAFGLKPTGSELLVMSSTVHVVASAIAARRLYLASRFDFHFAVGGSAIVASTGSQLVRAAHPVEVGFTTGQNLAAIPASAAGYGGTVIITVFDVV